MQSSDMLEFARNALIEWMDKSYWREDESVAVVNDRSRSQKIRHVGYGTQELIFRNDATGEEFLIHLGVSRVTTGQSESPSASVGSGGEA